MLQPQEALVEFLMNKRGKDLLYKCMNEYMDEHFKACYRCACGQQFKALDEAIYHISRLSGTELEEHMIMSELSK